ncbi:hypothetical protein ROHU_030980 [Labeo rohita]|uniref:Uncharacterized protein n=1 Tax=Labeo rohita TaxID=84645 RepID=A0A498LSU8_LABRO|nr:hypothetical protein ROHU_030980 [Labeo rohita]
MRRAVLCWLIADELAPLKSSAVLLYLSIVHYPLLNIQDSMRAALALSVSTKYSLKTIDQEELSAVFTHHASCSFPDTCFEYVEQE